MILAECLNIQQLQLDFFEMLSRFSDEDSKNNSLQMGLLDAVKTIDTRLARMASQFGGRWDVHQISQPPRADSLPTLDYYHDIQAAKVWNQQRCTRISLHEFFLDTYEKSSILDRCRNDENFEIHRRWSTEIITSMSSEICASIPFHLCELDANGDKCSSDAQQVAGACALIWPLETIANCRYNGVDHRAVARQTLEEIGYTMGVRQATRKLAECLGK